MHILLNLRPRRRPQSSFRNDKEQCVDRDKNKQNYDLEIGLPLPRRLRRVQKSLGKFHKEQENKKIITIAKTEM